MIGIIGAMEEEVAKLKELCEDREEIQKGPYFFVKGKLSGHEVVLCKAGIGKVNAAACTQALIDAFSPEQIINTGVAGAIAEDIHVLDLLVSKDALQYDMDATEFGYPLGQIPREEDLEMSYGLMILGSKKRYKKQGLFPKWGAKLSGEEGRCENEEELFKLVKANLCLLAKEKGIQEELLLVGAKAEMGAKLLSALQEESSLSLRLAEDILQSPEGIQALSNHKYIVMAYSAKTDLLSLLKSKKKAEALGKEVLGLVIY